MVAKVTEARERPESGLPGAKRACFRPSSPWQKSGRAESGSFPPARRCEIREIHLFATPAALAANGSSDPLSIDASLLSGPIRGSSLVAVPCSGIAANLAALVVGFDI